MPPVFLAFVVDRVVRTIQRHVLGMDEARSPWSVLADATRRITRLWVLSVLYVLRFAVDRRNTCAGLKQAILNATPLPETAPAAPVTDVVTSYPKSVSVLHAALSERAQRNAPGTRRGGATKTARFLELVKERHGELADIPLDQASQIATAIAPEAELHPASARTALLRAVRAALPAGEGDAR